MVMVPILRDSQGSTECQTDPLPLAAVLRSLGMADEMMIVRATDATVVPWRNGGGSTREYFKVGGDDFDWRLSVAQIVQPGPFSAFPGIDRILVLLSGDGVHLRFGTAESTTLAQPLDHVRFAGETAVDSTPLGGPTTDLNLMWRRDRFTADVEVARLTAPTVLGGGGMGVAFVASGTLHVGDHELRTGDAVRWQGGLNVGASNATLVHFTLLNR